MFNPKWKKGRLTYETRKQIDNAAKHLNEHKCCKKITMQARKWYPDEAKDKAECRQTGEAIQTQTSHLFVASANTQRMARTSRGKINKKTETHDQTDTK